MSRNILGKLLLSLAILAWAIFELTPINDTPFDAFIQERATAEEAAFASIYQEAEMRVASGEAPSVYVALKEMGEAQQINYARFFPDVEVADLKNLNKRNDVLLAHLLKSSQGKIRQGLDLKGGVAFTLELDHTAEEMWQKEAHLDKAIQIMASRVNALGVAEPIIRAKGTSQIEIQLPGLNTKDNPNAIYALKKPAKLEFRLVHPDAGLNPLGATPLGFEKLSLDSTNPKTGEIQERTYFVQKLPLMTGKGVKSAYVNTTSFGGYEVGLSMTNEGAKRFAEVTRVNVGRQLAIVLDGTLYSAPVINHEIPHGNASISGDFDVREAMELANVLNNPLEFELKLQEMYEIGPSLASDARDSSIRAALLGAGLVVLFMLIYYMSAGLVAVLSVGVNVVLVLGILASIQATMTLPGIAALVLTIGMGVDANILIFERIREELRSGKKLKSAFASGYDKAFSTIIDSNLTTLLTAAILIWLGTGPVKGFGVTLAIGIATSMFCALVLSKALLEILIQSGLIRRLIPKSWMKKDPKVNFLNWGRSAFIISWIVVALGVGAVAYKGQKIYGIDFLGGDELTLRFDEKLSLNAMADLASDEALGEISPVYRYSVGDDAEMLKLQTETGMGRRVLDALEVAFPDAGLELVGESSIGASVSDTLKWDAFLALGAALVGVLLYIAFRFEFSYGIGAIVSTIHDVLMSIGIYVMLGGQFTAPMVAAVLMIVGYSINDTIVVFDRIREELDAHPTSKLRTIINGAINKTLSRTLLTSVTTFLAASALYVFGAGQIDDFALMFMIGIVTGTFSSIFVASPVLYWWHKGDRRKIEKSKTTRSYEWDASTKISQ